MRRKISGSPDASGPAGGDGLQGPARAPAWIRGPAAWANKHRWIVFGTLSALAVAAALFLSLFLGFQTYRHQVNPLYWFFDKVDRKIERTFFKIPPKLADTEYVSSLINLQASVAVLDIGRSGKQGPMSENGGGLTSFGDDVLLLAYNGRIYAARDAQHVRETRVLGPDNHRAAFQDLKADSAIMASHQFDFTNLRYNDLKFFDSGTERGLIASYSEYDAAERCYTNTLAVLTIDKSVASIDDIAAAPGDWKVVFRTKPCLPLKTDSLALEGQMAGGRMALQAPSTVFLTSGDYHFDAMRSDGAPIAQDPTAQYGKVLKVDIRTGASEIISMGHRNPQGIVAMPDGRVLTVEHGPQGGDELNLIRHGANYGWPLESYGTTYRSAALPNSLSYGRHETFEKPVFAWVPSVTTSSITRVEGFDEAWNGDLLIGTLTDMSLQRVRMEGDRAVYAERIPVGTRVRYVHQHTDGRIVLWTDNEELIFLASRPRVDEHAELEDFLDDRNIPAGIKARVRASIDRCSECHSFRADQHDRSPGLGRVFSADIASTSFESYSQALRDRQGRWTKENLTAFLSNPERFAPGTLMPNPQIGDPQTTEVIVEYLKVRRTRF